MTKQEYFKWIDKEFANIEQIIINESKKVKKA